jgi:hypothetical protein
MAQIQIGIEGETAPAAAEALLQIPGVCGDYAAPAQKEAITAAIATIIGIAGGSVALAEQIRKWYQEWQSAHSQKLHNVVIYNPDTGERLFLEQATIEEIAEILKALE